MPTIFDVDFACTLTAVGSMEVEVPDNVPPHERIEWAKAYVNKKYYDVDMEVLWESSEDYRVTQFHDVTNDKDIRVLGERLPLKCAKTT